MADSTLSINRIKLSEVLESVGGSTYPDLGSTTARLGNVYLGPDKDLHPNSDAAGIATRHLTFWRGAWAENFRGDFEWLTTGWAGAPLNGTPDSISWADADLLRLTDGTQNDRFFRYRSINDPSGGSWNIIARVYPALGCITGIRIDSGGNTDFAELYIVQTEGTGCHGIVGRYQENGGGINTNTYFTEGWPTMWWMVQIAAAAANVLWPYYAVNGVIPTYIGGVAGTLGDMDNWSAAASRVGILYSRTSAQNNRFGYFDGFDYGGLTPS